MHQTPAETAAFINELRQYTTFDSVLQPFLIPPFTSLVTVAPLLVETPIWLGAQTMHWAEQGAYTGEISPTILQAIGTDLVMLGHAERRTLFGETDGALRKKVSAAIKAGLRILLCVGEQAEQRALDISQEVIAIQLKTALFDVPIALVDRLLIAYEPVWSIGENGTPADPPIVATMHSWIRQVLTTKFGSTAQTIPLLYGGSVNQDNCATYAGLPNVNGLFVGRAAWQPHGFINVMQTSYTAHQSKNS